MSLLRSGCLLSLVLQDILHKHVKPTEQKPDLQCCAFILINERHKAVFLKCCPGQTVSLCVVVTSSVKQNNSGTRSKCKLCYLLVIHVIPICCCGDQMSNLRPTNGGGGVGGLQKKITVIAKNDNVID